MVRGINKWLWHYMAIAMYNKLKKVCLACEAIMLAERSQAYTFLVHFLFENFPSRKPEDVLVVSGDGVIFSETTIEELKGMSYVGMQPVSDPVSITVMPRELVSNKCVFRKDMLKESPKLPMPILKSACFVS